MSYGQDEDDELPEESQELDPESFNQSYAILKRTAE